MQGQCVVAVYGSRNEAEQAYRAILGSGIPNDHVRMSDQQLSRGQAGTVTGTATEGSFWDWLFGSDVPETERQLYDNRLAQGGTALSVFVDSPSIANIDAVEDMLERYHPMDMHAENIASGGSQAREAAQGREGEQVIPLPEEELSVGKRATERVKHIRTYVVEEPVEKDVTLRDERTIIEKRPATGAASGGPTERELEVREVHEEPVVRKDTRAGEELVVRKEATERTERVGDTVKKTKADIDKDVDKRGR